MKKLALALALLACAPAPAAAMSAAQLLERCEDHRSAASCLSYILGATDMARRFAPRICPPDTLQELETLVRYYLRIERRIWLEGAGPADVAVLNALRHDCGGSASILELDRKLREREVREHPAGE